MDGVDYFRDDFYFDTWDTKLKKSYYRIEGFHVGIIYNGTYSFVYTREYDTVLPDRDVEQTTWYNILLVAIEENCLDDILFDIPDLQKRIENTTAEDYKNFYKLIIELQE